MTSHDLLTPSRAYSFSHSLGAQKEIIREWQDNVNKWTHLFTESEDLFLDAERGAVCIQAQKVMYVFTGNQVLKNTTPWFFSSVG